MAVSHFGVHMEIFFYHGIGEQLAFPEYVARFDTGVNIVSPLSTSTKLEVAINFTNFNQGLIITFSTKYIGSDARCFEVSWLSDFPNESEHLFLQNERTSTLDIIDIVEASSGITYGSILSALKIIHVSICGFPICDTLLYRIKCTCKFMSFDGVNQELKFLIIRIIQHQLSLDPITTLTEYAQNLINIFCQNREYCQIDFNDKGHLFVIKLFVDDETQWINLDMMSQLFPNVHDWQFTQNFLSQKNVKMTGYVLDRVLKFLSLSTIKDHKMCISGQSDINLKQLLSGYWKSFQQIGYVLTVQTEHTIYIVEYSQWEREQETTMLYSSFSPNLSLSLPLKYQPKAEAIDVQHKMYPICVNDSVITKNDKPFEIQILENVIKTQIHQKQLKKYQKMLANAYRKNKCKRKDHFKQQSKLFRHRFNRQNKYQYNRW
eukprot:471320_1